jgi:hypothetical protein|tara:strand:- start:637 stop:816 length:180 start_codon:yes stop_codon:yes gene_type:complete
MSGAPALAARLPSATPQYSQAGTNRLVSMLELELKNARLSNDASKQTVLLDAERVAWFF